MRRTITLQLGMFTMARHDVSIFSHISTREEAAWAGACAGHALVRLSIGGSGDPDADIRPVVSSSVIHSNPGSITSCHLDGFPIGHRA